MALVIVTQPLPKVGQAIDSVRENTKHQKCPNNAHNDQKNHDAKYVEAVVTSRRFGRFAAFNFVLRCWDEGKWRPRPSMRAFVLERSHDRLWIDGAASRFIVRSKRNSGRIEARHFVTGTAGIDTCPKFIYISGSFGNGVLGVVRVHIESTRRL